MKFNRKTLLALSLGALTGMGGVGAAQADVLTSSYVKFTGFEIQYQSTDTAVDLTDFNLLSYTTNANIGASLGSVGGLAIVDVEADASSGGFDPTATPPAIPIDTIDLPFVCQGNCTTQVENAFPVVTTSDGVSPDISYSSADQLEEGAPISGIPDINNPGNSIPTGANIIGAASGELVNADEGQATANNTLTGTFQFAPSQDLDLQIVFNLETYLESFVSTDEPLGASADNFYKVALNIAANDTSLGQSFNLAGAENIGNLVSDGTIVNGGNTLLSASTDRDSLSDGVSFYGDAIGDPAGPESWLVTIDFTFLANEQYTFNFNIQNEANMRSTQQVVPEPGILSLLGASMLFGLVGIRSRRRRLAA